MVNKKTAYYSRQESGNNDGVCKFNMAEPDEELFIRGTAKRAEHCTIGRKVCGKANSGSMNMGPMIMLLTSADPVSANSRRISDSPLEP